MKHIIIILSVEYIIMIYKPNVLLCCSSAGFILTSLYGYKKSHYMFQIDLLSASFSLVYWADPTNRYKRIMDICTANIACTMFFIHMYKNTTGKMRYFMWFGISGVVTCFTLSCITSRIQYDKWKYYHFMFHMFAIANKYIAYNSNLIL
jgi:hypothetical protein